MALTSLQSTRWLACAQLETASLPKPRSLHGAQARRQPHPRHFKFVVAAAAHSAAPVADLSESPSRRSLLLALAALVPYTGLTNAADNLPSSVFVAGATGQTGRRVVAELRRMGIPGMTEGWAAMGQCVSLSSPPLSICSVSGDIS